MTDKQGVWASMLIVLLLAAMVSITRASEGVGAGPLVQTLASIQKCMRDSPGPWPESWRDEYLDTIRQTVTANKHSPGYSRRLDILTSGFPWLWESIEKSDARPSFEVHCARIRWYVEQLMEQPLANDSQQRILRHQCRDLLAFATDSLLTQFPFLEPNRVRMAERDFGNQCHRHIETPLEPGFTTPFSDAQFALIKQRWSELRPSRVDFMIGLGGEAVMLGNVDDSVSAKKHPHYLLAAKAINQFLNHIQAMTNPPPEYYRKSLRRRNDSVQRRYRTDAIARQQERHLAKTTYGQTLLTEQLSFLLAALLESSRAHESWVENEPNYMPFMHHRDAKTKGGEGP